MPTYDFRCLSCHRRFDVFAAYKDYDPSLVRCPHCQSSNVQRRIGRIRVAHSEESRLENIADPSSLAGLEDDPVALGKMMRKMSAETGEEMGPEFDEVINRLEAGQSPDEIEKSVPGLSGEDGEAPAGGLDDMGDF